MLGEKCGTAHTIVRLPTSLNGQLIDNETCERCYTVVLYCQEESSNKNVTLKKGYLKQSIFKKSIFNKTSFKIN